MEPRVKLESDFRDYYDHAFDSEGVVWERKSETDMNRYDMFVKLQEMRLQVPEHGICRHADMQKHERVVVYMDLCRHRGEGKALLHSRTAAHTRAGCFCAAYLEPDTTSARSVSLRYLRIGHVIKWLQYSSNDTWRSNWGMIWIDYIEPPNFLRTFMDHEPYPMLAIDFVQAKNGLWAAVDLNTSPGLRNTPVEEELDAGQIYELIKWWYR